MKRLVLLLLAACSAEPMKQVDRKPIPDASSNNEVDGGGMQDGVAPLPDGGDAGPPPGPGDFLAQSLLRPTNLLLAGSDLLWVAQDSTGGQLVQMAKTGGTPTALASNLIQPEALRADATDAYWLSFGQQTAGIYKISRSGGMPARIVQASAPMPLRDLALGASDVFYTNAPGGSVLKVSKSGGSPTTVMGGLKAPTSIVVDGSDLFVIESDAKAIVKINGNQKTTLASNQHDPRELAVTAQDVYWIDAGTFDTMTQKITGAAILRVPRSGGSPTTVLAIENANHLALTGSSLYTIVGDTVKRVPVNGGMPTDFAPGQKGPSSLAADSTHLFWSAQGTAEKNYQDGTIRRLPH